MVSGDLTSAVAQFREVASEAAPDGDATWAQTGLFNAAQALCYLGDIGAARVSAVKAREAAGDRGSVYDQFFSVIMGFIAVAAGDLDAAESADEKAWGKLSHELSMVKTNLWRRAALALVRDDPAGARRWADQGVSETTGWHRAVALTTRCRVATVQGDTQQAESDAHAALATAAEVGAQLGIADTLECLAVLADVAGAHSEAARLCGAADGIRQRTGEVRFQIYQPAY